jgi:hypothetical protein
MDFLRILDLQELVRVEVTERDIGGECKIDRHFRKPKDSNLYISTSTNENRFTGSYYYQQDAIMAHIGPNRKLEAQQVEEVKRFCENVLPKKSEVPSLLDLTSSFLLQTKCPSTFEVFRKTFLEGQVPENVIEHMHVVYKKISLQPTTDLQKFRNALLAEELHVTEEEIQKHIPDILGVVLRDLPESVSRQTVPDELKHLFTVENIRKIVAEHYKGTAKLRVVVGLPGAPYITVSSESNEPFLVPWNITFQPPLSSTKHVFTTHSTELTKMIAPLLEGTLTPHVEKLLYPERSFWNSELWKKTSLRQHYEQWIIANDLN